MFSSVSWLCYFLHLLSNCFSARTLSCHDFMWSIQCKGMDAQHLTDPSDPGLCQVKEAHMGGSRPVPLVGGDSYYPLEMG